MLTAHSNNRRVLSFKEHGIDDIYLLGSYKYNTSNRNLKMHQHTDMMEICFLSKGNQIYLVNGEHYFLQGGDVFLTFPDEQHGTGLYPEDKGTLYWLQINLSNDQKTFCNHTGAEALIFRGKLLQIPHRHFKSEISATQDLENIFELFKGDSNPFSKIKFYSYITRILLNIIQASETPITHKLSEDIQIIVKQIENNTSELLTIDSLADNANLSLSRFKAKFKKQLGIPPGEFITRKKIEKAKLLLTDNSLSITDISYQLNFANSQYFASVFKKYTQMTPTNFRNQ